MNKSPDAFRTISEVADLLETPAHVLRFWESRFPQIKPVKRAGGRRYYRPADVELLIGIRRLLHDDGMTIRGVQKILREQGVRHVSGLSDEDESEAVELPFEEAVRASSDPIVLFPRPKPPVEAGQPPVVMPPPAESEAAKGPDDALSAADTMGLGPAPLESVDVEPDPGEPEIADPDLAKTEQDRVDARAEAAAMPEAGGAAAKPTAPGGASSHTDAPTKRPDLAEDSATTDHAAKLQPALPGPLPAAMEITGHWLPADLRALYPGAFGAKHDQVRAILGRLEALRNRVGDLGRVPRR